VSRVQGCCRDHALLAIAVLRHNGIPARRRVGFAPYLSPTWNHDHVIVQTWMEGRWREFDPELVAPREQLSDPADIPIGPDGFLTASQVWVAHRQGLLDVARFGVAEGLGIEGEGFVGNHVIREVAHRFKDELLLWDEWGAIGSDVSGAAANDPNLLDEIAELCLLADRGDELAERDLLSRCVEDERLHPSDHVKSWSPTGVRFDVDLSTREARFAG
jgi:Transglutaminase-like superfamily